MPGLALGITLTVTEAELLLTVPMEGLRTCPAMPVHPHDRVTSHVIRLVTKILQGWSSFLYRQRITIEPYASRRGYAH